MNGTIEKATRRDLRRAVGVGALEVIERLRVDVAAQARTIDALRILLRRVETQLNENRTHVLTLADEQRAYVDRGDKITDVKVDAFLARGFWARVRWLVRGR